MSDNLHERDIVATNEMINTLRASTFRKYAFGSAAVLAVVFAGTAAVVWAAKSGNDPEHLKEALRHMPALQVQVKLDPDSTVKLADGGTVTLANPPVFPQAALGNGGGSHDPAISTSVTVFKSVDYDRGYIVTGWRFANGAATKPDHEYCYYKVVKQDGSGQIIENIADDGKLNQPPPGVLPLEHGVRFAKCQWFRGAV
jgi:hypothetical protein